MILLPIGLIFAMDVYSQYWFIQRQFVFVMPFFAFFVAWSWDAIFLKAADVMEIGSQ